MSIKIGATSWAERTLVASGWYPPEAHTAEARLRYYASRFPVAENDSAYYAIPEDTQLWVDRTPPGFTMNIKAHALLTGHYSDPRRLPLDIRKQLPGHLLERNRVYPRDLGEPVMDEIGARFREALRPLYASGRLGVVLFQFPMWFPISRDHKRTLARIRRRWEPYRVAVEFRNQTWMSPRNREETIETLRELGLVYTCVDEPQGFVSSVPPILVATADVALVRMHGRNAARWRHGADTAAELFEYLYSIGELHEWVPRIQRLAEQAAEVHLLFNNCHGDYAVRNAQMMIDLMQQRGVETQPPA